MSCRAKHCLVSLVALNLVGCAMLSRARESIPVALPSLAAASTPSAVTATHSLTVTPTPIRTLERGATPTPEVTSHGYARAFGIDYAHPELYLAQGEQSQISDPTALDGLRADQQSLAQLGDIYRWLKDDFAAYRAGGKTIGTVTVDQLLEERRLGGCHDHGLVYATVARELGYPSVMARTCSLAWVEGFQSGEKGPHVGHVFVEVFLDGKWVLVDSTNGWYVEDGYEPENPVIPLRGRVAGSSDETYGFHVERKGIDTWAFGIHSQAESTQAMDDFARQLDLESVVYPEYVFGRFSK